MRALLFDLDDTLFDRGAAFLRWTRDHLGRLDDDDLTWLVELDGRGRRPRHEFAARVVDRFRLAREPAELGAAFPAELAALVEPEPGVRDAVIALAAGHRVAVVTNGGAAQRDKLRRAGLDDVLPVVFVSGELGVAKPAPAIFERALQWTEVDRHETLFVGDDPSADLAPAAALGMLTAWRVRGAWPAHLAPPTFELHSLGELVELCT